MWNAFGQKPMTNEVTLEANPGTITQEKIRCWKQAGVTRVSVGVQAAQNILLKRLGKSSYLGGDTGGDPGIAVRGLPLHLRRPYEWGFPARV